jgi:hypothetical protein
MFVLQSNNLVALLDQIIQQLLRTPCMVTLLHAVKVQ